MDRLKELGRRRPPFLRVRGTLLRLTPLSLALACALTSGQTVLKKPRRVSVPAKPECAPGAIFSGEIRDGQEFRRNLNSDLVFVLRLPGGIDVVPIRHMSCRLSAWVANPPLRAHHETEIDAAYDWTAEQEVETSPRKFRFVTDCDEFRRLYDFSNQDGGEYFANLKLLAKGEGRLWITDSRVTHAHGSVSPQNGAIEWMRFTVEIKLPKPN